MQDIDSLNEEIDEHETESLQAIQASGIDIDPEDFDELNRLADKFNELDADDPTELKIGEE